jgi:hypothetical protein
MRAKRAVGKATTLAGGLDYDGLVARVAADEPFASAVRALADKAYEGDPGVGVRWDMGAPSDAVGAFFESLTDDNAGFDVRGRDSDRDAMLGVSNDTDIDKAVESGDWSEMAEAAATQMLKAHSKMNVKWGQWKPDLRDWPGLAESYYPDEPDRWDYWPPKDR